MADYVFGDKNVQRGGRDNTFTVYESSGSAPGELDAAIAELRSFIAQLTRDGVIGPDGKVADPAAVVTAVEQQPGRLRMLGRAVAGGAKDAVLAAVRDGVATLVVALVGRG